jgi:ElaB/YqjD/DUF883 family membrane-anchored ribosome-binding protein
MNENKTNVPRSGSDTASAARISAGTSVGTAGRPATPDYRAPADGTGQGSSRTAASQSSGPQDSARGTADSIRESAAGATETVRQSARAAMDQASEWMEQGSRQWQQARGSSMQQFRRAGGGIERFVSENPLVVGVMGLAAGLVIGALLPRTRQEDRAFGRWADEVRDQGMRYARDATQRGREFVEDALSATESRFDGSEGDWEEEDRGRGSSPRYQNH